MEAMLTIDSHLQIAGIDAQRLNSALDGSPNGNDMAHTRRSVMTACPKSSISVCVYVYVYMCIYVGYVCLYVAGLWQGVCVYVYVDMCVYICMCICVCVYATI